MTSVCIIEQFPARMQPCRGPVKQICAMSGTPALAWPFVIIVCTVLFSQADQQQQQQQAAVQAAEPPAQQQALDAGNSISRSSSTASTSSSSSSQSRKVGASGPRAAGKKGMIDTSPPRGEHVVLFSLQ